MLQLQRSQASKDKPAQIARRALQDQINQERNRRLLENFVFMGHRFDFDPDSVANITGAGASAGVAVSLGAEEGDLRWADADTDFVWISADNTSVPMDAHTCFAFSQAAMAHKRSHIFAARALKDLDEILADWRADTHWPSIST